MGSISTRQHIRWGCDTPSEPTSTLVITSPGRHFVDIRVLKTAYNDAPASSQTSDSSEPSTANQLSETSGVLPLSSLDWAFGGTSSSYPITQPDGSKATHAAFLHWVDSRTTEPETIVDEGDMLPDPTDAELTLETGRMVNPETGISTEYQELWRDQQPRFVMDRGVGRVAVLVMRLHDDAKGMRGLWVRLGMNAQGVLRVGDKFTAERWQYAGITWPESGKFVPIDWQRNFKVGDEGIGSFESIATHNWGLDPNVKETIEANGGVWEVVEMKVAGFMTTLR